MLFELLLEARSVFLDVLIAFLPLAVFFVLYQISTLRLSWSHLWKLLAGSSLALLGLGFLLLGIQFGLQPFAQHTGDVISRDYQYLLLPIGLILGFIAGYAEPAIRVLSYEVEKTTAGSISFNLVFWSVTISVALMGLLNMMRLTWTISFEQILLWGYGLSLVMMLFSDETFLAVAFDAGAVATGPFMVSFVLPFNLGAAKQMPGKSALLDGFGVIALVGLAPFLVILFLGLIINIKRRWDTYV